MGKRKVEMLHQLLHDMFGLNLPILEKIIRPILVYVFLIIVLRVFGKRELAQLNPFDLVVLLSLSNTVQNAIIGDDNTVTGGFIGEFTLLFVNYVVVRFLFRHRRLDQILEGKPSILIHEGKINKKDMAKELITMAELQSVCRRQGFEGVHEVETCVLEPGGAFVMKSKCPSDTDVKHQEIVAALEAIRARLAELNPA
jgi:uncharacterized membrane protein YcaP (DUF421 family)